MAGSRRGNRIGKALRRFFHAARVGVGTEHENVSRDKPREVVIQVNAFTVDPDKSILPPKGKAGEPRFLAISRSVDGVECVVDTGATVSTFRAEIAKKLGLDPNDGDLSDGGITAFDGRPGECCWCRQEVYLGIGPKPIPVLVAFPVKPVEKLGSPEYQWIEDYPPENILGMESVLSRRTLCFTPDRLYVFKRRP